MIRPELPTLLTPREWSVLRYAWRRGRFHAAEIATDLAAANDPLSRYALNTLLRRAAIKGYIRRVDAARPIYEIAIPYPRALQREIAAFFAFLGNDDTALRLVAEELKRRTA